MYLVQCKTCQIQCIGENGASIRKRMKLHQSHIRTCVNGPVSRNLNSEKHKGLSDFQFYISSGSIHQRWKK